VRDEGPWVVNRFYRGKNCVSLLFGEKNRNGSLINSRCQKEEIIMEREIPDYVHSARLFGKILEAYIRVEMNMDVSAYSSAQIEPTYSKAFIEIEVDPERGDMVWETGNARKRLEIFIYYDQSGRIKNGQATIWPFTRWDDEFRQHPINKILTKDIVIILAAFGIKSVIIPGDYAF